MTERNRVLFPEARQGLKVSTRNRQKIFAKFLGNPSKIKRSDCLVVTLDEMNKRKQNKKQLEGDAESYIIYTMQQTVFVCGQTEEEKK